MVHFRVRNGRDGVVEPCHQQAGGSAKGRTRTVDEGNNVAHLLAQFSFVSPGDCFWLEETPSCVLDAVNAEMALI